MTRPRRSAFMPPLARRAGGWPPGWIVPAGSHVDRRVLPRSVPPAIFFGRDRRMQVPIGPRGFAQGLVSGAGSVTLNIGPDGAGTSWDLAQVSVATTSGAADASTVAFYAQPTGTVQAPWQVGQSYAGGGDQVGLAGIKLVPGERLYAVWSGGKSGDVATMILTGVMTVLS